ncbi:hypothetical protein COE51_03005 [Bacillus pseudomycoides]|nr:hypothetical protein COE51_03005 [Bacillus pseudomycoides]
MYINVDNIVNTIACFFQVVLIIYVVAHILDTDRDVNRFNRLEKIIQIALFVNVLFISISLIYFIVKHYFLLFTGLSVLTNFILIWFCKVEIRFKFKGTPKFKKSVWAESFRNLLFFLYSGGLISEGVYFYFQVLKLMLHK